MRYVLLSVTALSTVAAAVFCALWLLGRSASPRDTLVLELGPFGGEPDISMPIFATVRREGGRTVGGAALHNDVQPAVLFVRRRSYVVSVRGCNRTAHVTTTGVNVFAIFFSGHIGKHDTTGSRNHARRRPKNRHLARPH